MENSCTYQYRDKTTCKEPQQGNSGYCFWHDPNADRLGADIKKILDEKHKKGEKLEGFNLQKANLEGINFTYSDLYNVNFKRANLRGAHFFGSNLNKTNLFKANLESANLKQTTLYDAELLGARLGNASLDNVEFGNDNKIKNEIEGDIFLSRGETDKAAEKYYEAMEIYLNIKNNFKNRGLQNQAGRYFYREMVMQRKLIPYFTFERFWSFLLDISSGYGEKPFKIIGFSAIIMFGFMFIFSLTGLKDYTGEISALSANQTMDESLLVLFNSLYYSVVTFTTLGNSEYIPYGIGKIFTMLEAYTGFFLIVLFVITIYKRYMER
ncbi:MAG: pentapeptide repeat-containing protein [Nitrospinota bacterium]|nr:pentapeptide repeat-containing protein [Nitrospinota bacterium]